MPNPIINRRIGGVQYDAFVLDWVRRVVKNGGGRPSNATINAVQTFYRATVGFGLFSKLNGGTSILMVPDNFIASTTPFFIAGGGGVVNDPWTNTAFVSADLNSNGLVGNGSTKFLDTGFNPNTRGVLNDIMGVTLYISTATNSSNQDFGAADGSYNNTVVLQADFGGTTFWDCPFDGGLGRASAANSLWAGYLSANTTATNARNIYKANSSNAHASFASNTTAVSIGSVNLSLYCYSINYVSPTFSDRRFSYAGCHQALTATDSANLFTAIQNFRKQLGGGFI